PQRPASQSQRAATVTPAPAACLSRQGGPVTVHPFIFPQTAPDSGPPITRPRRHPGIPLPFPHCLVLHWMPGPIPLKRKTLLTSKPSPMRKPVLAVLILAFFPCLPGQARTTSRPERLEVLFLGDDRGHTPIE